jgi:hypothetical protein
MAEEGKWANKKLNIESKYQRHNLLFDEKLNKSVCPSNPPSKYDKK